MLRWLTNAPRCLRGWVYEQLRRYRRARKRHVVTDPGPVDLIRPARGGALHVLSYPDKPTVHGFLTAVQRGGLGLSGVEQDRYYREQVRVAQLLGASEVPASRAEVADYLQQIRPQLVCSPTTRTGARLLLAPPMPWRVRLLTPARPAWAALGALSFCLMPRWARRLYRLPGLPTTDMGATLALRALRSAAMRVPERHRVGPLVLAARQRAVHQVLPTA